MYLMYRINKILRQILAGFIPSKRWRRVFREGYTLLYIRFLIKRLLCDKNQKNKYFLSAVLMVKNAACYMDEWINYHKLVGVDHFYIYDNESTDNLKEVLKPYIKSGLVTYTYWKGKGQQRVIYTDALLKYMDNSKWMTFIDDDEFIVPVSQKTIPDVIKKINPKYGLSICWCMYGSNGLKKKTDDLVIERFTKHEDLSTDKSVLCKVIFNPKLVKLPDVHLEVFVNKGTSVDENGDDTFNEGRIKQVVNKIRVNHYHLKSEEEFFNKKKRGDSLSLTGYYKGTKEWFDNTNKECDIVKDDIMKKYVPEVKKMIKKIRGK